MTCEHCGKELEKIGVLTEEELNNYQFIISKENVANDAIMFRNSNMNELDSESLYMFMKSAYDLKCESEFMKVLFFNNLAKKYNVKTNEIMLSDDNIPCILIHKKEEN